MPPPMTVSEAITLLAVKHTWKRLPVLLCEHGLLVCFRTLRRWRDRGTSGQALVDAALVKAATEARR
jgi:hypothetical protein